MASGTYAQVIVDLPVANVDKVYHYGVPEQFRQQVTTGARVLVPFGRRKLTGYVVGISSAAGVEQVKDILAVLDAQPAFTPELLALARWLAERYLCTISEAIAAVAAPTRKAQPRYRDEIYAVEPESGAGALKLPPKQALVWETARRRPGLTRAQLASAAGVSPGVVNSLMGKGALRMRCRAERRDPYPDTFPGNPVTLFPEQEAAFKEIDRALDKGAGGVFLLHGVTGSGKTEVYLRAIESCLARGKQALALMPEIALTGQMVARFKGQFGEKVAVLHSRLGAGMRLDEWTRVFNGEAPVVLGTRSAVFAPLQKIGLIVIDEEHEPSYKQDEDPKYHAREVALKRSAAYNAVVVLGSATPSLRVYAQAVKGENCRLIRMRRRVDARPMPVVSVVDMRAEHRAGVKGVFSRVLAGKINERLAHGEQVILFLNRRGFATVVVCRECGNLLQCPHCAIGLTYHRDGLLRCHYCGYRLRMPEKCPECRGDGLSRFGTGTQKVEDEAAKRFPGARILRLDSDAVTRKGSHDWILDTFKNREAEILVGTQMLAKGLDLPGVTLVGVVNADTTLFLPDFRAAERTFQLLEQVSGRAGRGSVPGEVVFQTYSPEHYSIQAAARHAYEEFFAREMTLRRKLLYPPFSSLARVLFRGRSEEKVRAAAEHFARCLREPGVEILGPAAAPVMRVKDAYRWHVILKAGSRTELVQVLRRAQAAYAVKPVRGVAVGIDIDPQATM